MIWINGIILLIEMGIHTFGLFHSFSYSDSQNIIELLQKKGRCRKIKCDAANINRTYVSDYFSTQGVLVYIYQRITGKSGIMLRITPCTLLKKQYAATELYRPTKENYRQLKSPLNNILDKLGVPLTVDKMSVCRVDLCANIHFKNDATTSEYMRIVKKYGEINHYKPVRYEKGSKIVKDVKIANEHSYRISSKRTSFTIYDKKFVLQQLERCPNDLLNKGVLRVEAELKREALLKRIHAKKGWSNYRILATAERNAKSVLRKYLKQANGGTGRHLRYSDAVDVIEHAKIRPKMQKRMLFLLRKVSDSQTLTAAVEKVKKQFDLSNNQCKTLLKKFEKLGISPITLRNNSDYDALPSLLSILDEE